MRFVCFLLLLLLPATAFAADILATWQDGQGNLMKVAHRDDSHIRMDTQPDSYMLLSEDKVYIVTKDEGEWQVVDLDQMSGMMAMLGKDATPTAGSYSSTIKKTSRTEKIASYKGTVYLVEVRDANQQLVDKAEVVFSGNSDVKRASQAMTTLSMKMAGKMGGGVSREMSAAMRQADDHNYGGVLRYGADMMLVNMEKGALPADYFMLPQNADQIDVGSQPAVQSQKKGGFLGTLLGDSESAAKEETRSGTVEEVREGVRGMLNNLFD